MQKKSFLGGLAHRPLSHLSLCKSVEEGDACRLCVFKSSFDLNFHTFSRPSAPALTVSWFSASTETPRTGPECAVNTSHTHTTRQLSIGVIGVSGRDVTNQLTSVSSVLSSVKTRLHVIDIYVSRRQSDHSKVPTGRDVYSL